MNEDSYVIPVHAGMGGHPVLLGKNIVRKLIIQDTVFDFREVLKKFNRIEILWEFPGILLNINSPDDYRKFMDDHRSSLA